MSSKRTAAKPPGPPLPIESEEDAPPVEPEAGSGMLGVGEVGAGIGDCAGPCEMPTRRWFAAWTRPCSSVDEAIWTVVVQPEATCPIALAPGVSGALPTVVTGLNVVASVVVRPDDVNAGVVPCPAAVASDPVGVAMIPAPIESDGPCCSRTKPGSVVEPSGNWTPGVTVELEPVTVPESVEPPPLIGVVVEPVLPGVVVAPVAGGITTS